MLVLLVVPATSGYAAPTPSAAQMRHTIADLQTQMEQATEDFNSAQVQVTRSVARQAELQTRAQGQRKRVDQLEAVVADLAASAYRNGRIDVMTSMLDSGSPQNFLDQMSTIDNLSRTQRGQLDSLIAAKKTLDRQQREIAAELTTQRKNEKVLAARKDSITNDLIRWQALGGEQITRASRDVQRGIGGTYTGPASGSARVALAAAYAQLGKPYRWGAAGPGSFDCSGLMLFAWAKAGVSLPHSSRMQFNSGPHVARSALQPGDLLFFYNPIHHVAMYVGDGKMIHAPNTGDVVRITPVMSNLTGAVRP